MIRQPPISTRTDPLCPDTTPVRSWLPGWTDPVISADGRIVCLERPCHFAWRVGIKGLPQIEEGFHLKKSPEGTRLTHRLCCSGIGSWPGVVTSPLLRRQPVRTGDSLERHLRRDTVISRYGTRNARPR